MNALYDRTSALRYKKGLLGYAVYCRLVELCANSPNGRLKYDVDAIVWDLRDSNVDSGFVDSVVGDFELFAVSGDYIEDVYCPSEIYQQQKKEEALKAARSAAGKKGAATKAAKKEESKKQDVPLQTEVKETSSVQEVDEPTQPVAVEQKKKRRE